MRLKNYLIEANTTKASNMEKRIVDAWNEGTDDEGLIKIIQYLKEQGVTGSAHHMKGMFPVTDKWKEYHPGKINKSYPKTDLIIGSHRISLKTGKKYHIAGSRKNESIAIFYAAVELGNIDIKNKLVKKLEVGLHSLIKKGTIFDTVKNSRGKDKKLDEAGRIQKEVQLILDDTFSNNEKLKYYYIYELISGTTKFGLTSPARATHVLNVNYDGSDTKLNSVDNPSYIKEVMSKCKFNISFESQSRKTKKALPGEREWKTTIRTMNEGIVSKILSFIKSAINKGLHYLLDLLNITPKIDISF
jgi:hypothetical protein